MENKKQIFEPKSMQNIVDKYRDRYSSSMPKLPARLPVKLGSLDDTYLRLRAIYSLEVELRNDVFKLDDDTDDKLKRVSRWLCDSSKRGLILMGNMGTGKSTMLKSIHRLLECWGMFGDAQDIFEYFKKNNGAMRYWDERLVLVDDLGVEPWRCMNYGEESFPLTRLLLHRYDRNLTTIVATNLDFPEIEKKYGDRLADRMFEMYDVLTYNNDSYRRQK